MLNRQGLCVSILSMWLIVATMATGESGSASSREQNAAWRHIQPFGFDTPMPIRLVGPDEPWEKVAQDVQQHIGAKVSGQEVHVGFYGHGAFVKPEELLKHDLPFVAALGLVARMDVMIFPQLPFPEKNPLQDIPQDILHLSLKDLFKNPAEIIEIARNKAHQLASESRYATAHAAVRLTAGISAFHRQHMTPSLAAFSNSALVIVKMGQLLEHGMISDGYKTIPVAQDVHQSIYVKNVVTFGYPLPHGYVSTALSHRITGAFTNVVPERFWKQLWGNFPLQGAVENIQFPGPRRITIGQDSTPRARKSRRSERSLGVEHIPRDERPG